jgi:hypothetical protein
MMHKSILHNKITSDMTQTRTRYAAMMHKSILHNKITSDMYNKKNLLVAAPSEARRVTLYEQCGSAYNI